MAYRGAFLSDVCRGRDNNLNLVRMVAATAVLVSHAWPVTGGPDTVQPLKELTGYNLGTHALFVFFCISGFLVARSYERQSTVRLWLIARFLRLMPALAVMLILTVLVLGPLVTTLPIAIYFSEPATQSYIPRNLTLALRQIDLPGVFQTLPMARETNGSLWTLYYEVLCYSALLVMGLFGAFRAWLPLVVAALVVVSVVALSILLPRELVPEALTTLLSLGLPFAIGVGFYICRRYLLLNPLILACLIMSMVLVKDTALYRSALMLTVCYGVFSLAYLPGGFIRRYNALGDYSYGLYIYAWPVQQVMLQAFGPMTPAMNVALALPVTLAFAWVSWTLVEKPALSLVPHSDPMPQLGDSACTPSRCGESERTKKH